MKIKNIILVVGSFIVNANADDLLTSYHQAIRNDPAYLENIADNNALKSQYNIDRATVLPAIGVDSSASNNRSFGVNSYTYTTGLNVQQNIFNYSDWLTLKADKMTAKQADLAIDASKQDLSLRLTETYLELAKQQEIVTLDTKQLALSKTLWTQSQLLFKAGAKTDVDVTESQAAYNQIQSTLIADETSLNDDTAKLASITGQTIKSVKIIRDDIPYLMPIPLNESAWINKVALHNNTVLADEAAANASHERIKIATAGYLPTVNTTLGYGYTKEKTNGFDAQSGSGPSVSFNLNIPIYQGGLVAASVEQNHYQYLASFDKMQLDKENFILQTRSSFIGIIRGIDSLKTTKELITANQKNYQETNFAYQGGIRNASDVVMSLDNLYQAQLSYLQAKYQYAENIIKLRYAVGNLSIVDIEKLNGWLV